VHPTAEKRNKLRLRRAVRGRATGPRRHSGRGGVQNEGKALMLPPQLELETTATRNHIARNNV